MTKVIKVFAPATVANLSCGFDVLSLALEGVGDTLTFRQSEQPGLRITQITGAELPTDPAKNIVTVVAQKLLRDHGVDIGLDIEIEKGVLPGSGLGSSASSGVAAALAASQFLPEPLVYGDLIPYAIEGEMLVSDAYIADNVAASMLGGMVLIRSAKPLHLSQLPVPEQLWVVVVRPHRVVETSMSRSILPTEVPMDSAIAQSANLGSFVHALHSDDYELMAECLSDQLAEPARKELIPEFEPIRQVAMNAGAIGGGISGSGPGIYHLCRGEEAANNVADAIKECCESLEIGFDLYVSRVAKNGARIVE